MNSSAMIDTYLAEVGRLLPADGREDVLDELRGSIEEQAEARDVEAVLTDMGHPLALAASYQQDRYLIGPSYYPSFKRTLWNVSLVACLMVVIIDLISGGQFDLMGLVRQLFSIVFWVFAIVTLVFVALEAAHEPLTAYRDWRPSMLPKPGVSIAGRQDLITNLISEGVFLLWWNDVLVFSNWFPGLGDVSLAPLFEPLFWPLNLVIGGFALLHIFVLLRGLWQRATLMCEIVLGCAFAAVLVHILLAPEALLVAVDGSLYEWAQRTVRISTGVVLGFVIWDLIGAMRRYIR